MSAQVTFYFRIPTMPSSISKEQNVDVKKSCYHAFAHLVNLLAMRSVDGISSVYIVSI